MMSGRNWTPYTIEIILHHYASGAPFPRWDAAAYAPELHSLRERGYLKTMANPIGANPSGISVTEKGRVFIELLLRTPEPRQVWLDPRDGKEIREERISLEEYSRQVFDAAEGPDECNKT